MAEAVFHQPSHHSLSETQARQGSRYQVHSQICLWGWGTRSSGSFVQCSMLFSAYLREKNRHSLCLVLPSFPSCGVADSTVALTLKKWDNVIRENRLRGFFPKKIYMHLNISFDFSSILYYTSLKVFNELLYLWKDVKMPFSPQHLFSAWVHWWPLSGLCSFGLSLFPEIK